MCYIIQPVLKEIWKHCAELNFEYVANYIFHVKQFFFLVLQTIMFYMVNSVYE
jgi:hypothetical protein